MSQVCALPIVNTCIIYISSCISVLFSIISRISTETVTIIHVLCGSHVFAISFYFVIPLSRAQDHSQDVYIVPRPPT